MEEPLERKQIDPRWIQLLTLGPLVIAGLGIWAFETSPFNALLLIASAGLTQLSLNQWTRAPWARALPSALITSFSLTLLLRGSHWTIFVLAGTLAVSSKFVFRWRGRHFFNPANFAIVVLMLLDQAWVSPGQWGRTPLLLLFLSFMGTLVTVKAVRWDVAMSFFLTYGGLIFIRTIYLGDPIGIPVHRLSSGGVLLFTLFMITDPRSTPLSRKARLFFGGSVGLMSWWGQTHLFQPDAIFYALFLASLGLGVSRLAVDNLGQRFRKSDMTLDCAPAPGATTTAADCSTGACC